MPQKALHHFIRRKVGVSFNIRVIGIEPFTSKTLVSYHYVYEWHVKAYPNIFRDNADEEFKKYFQSTLENPDCHHYVVYDDSKAIGLIQATVINFTGNAFRQPNKLVYVNIIVVHPEYRSKGVDIYSWPKFMN